MRTFVLFQVIAVFVCSIAIAYAKPVSSKGNAKSTSNQLVWKFEYARGLYTAPSTVYLGKDAVKIVTAGGYEVTAKAPEWTATIYRSNQKAYCHRPMKEWKTSGFFVDPDESGELDPKKAASDVKTTYMGLPARRMTWKTMEIDDYYQARTKAQPATTQFVQSTDIGCSPNQIALLSSWYGFPHLSGIPFQVQRRSANRVIYPLKLDSAEQIKSSEVSFDTTYPGSRKVAQMRDLIPSRIKDTMMMMFDAGPSKENNGTSKPNSSSKKSVTK